MNASLIVTVDTEEEGGWGGTYRRTGHTVENVREIPRFQRLCDRFGIRPTYLVDAPVVEDPRAVEILREIQDDGRAEIGAHLHPWCNPPFDEPADAYHSYLCNLPESLQRRKLTWLTQAIDERFGRRPTSFRAGRYGLDIVGARILSELEYQVDSSVIPFTDYSASGGPNFEHAPFTPYIIGEHSLCTPCETGPLLEVPVSVGFHRSNFSRAAAIRRLALRPWPRRLHSVGILDRLGLVRRIKFSPEQADAAQMKQLVRAYLAQQAPAIVMMFHSPSLRPGGSPYVKTQDELDQFYHDLETTFVYCLHRLHTIPQTLTGYWQSVGRVPEAASI